MSLSPSPLRLFLPILLPSLSLCFYVPSSSVLSSFNDQVRQRHLYTETKRQAQFLEMKPDGSVVGSPKMSQYTTLELRSIKAGHTVIKGLASSLFLCVDQKGHFRGEQTFIASDCNLQEVLTADGYSIFLSPHSGLPLSLRRRSGQIFFRFLPLTSDLSMEEQKYPEQQETLRSFNSEQNFNSHDPLGMAQSHSNTFFSPSLDTKR
ncbi:fibroblast growth factor 21 isoform X1 [Clupea harengus]|uniref:Fibroblast growth factor 21 isoform X1 n=1 Tax=Clupea harengus TaxID=7950 RepID=A0A6P8FS63_CLUHA|nr:fibroblast growth factor 21 isoform X1 [Clupea harengus]